MGPTRGRYFLLTGQALGAQEALQFGVVNEILPAGELMPRAYELARQLKRQSPAVRRFTRLLLTEEIRERMQRLLGYGLALEGLAVLEDNPDP
jgi:enoyl-CoA hydratase/carnithine racemase